MGWDRNAISHCVYPVEFMQRMGEFESKLYACIGEVIDPGCCGRACWPWLVPHFDEVCLLWTEDSRKAVMLCKGCEGPWFWVNEWQCFTHKTATRRVATVEMHLLAGRPSPIWCRTRPNGRSRKELELVSLPWLVTFLKPFSDVAWNVIHHHIYTKYGNCSDKWNATRLNFPSQKSPLHTERCLWNHMTLVVMCLILCKHRVMWAILLAVIHKFVNGDCASKKDEAIVLCIAKCMKRSYDSNWLL